MNTNRFTICVHEHAAERNANVCLTVLHVSKGKWERKIMNKEKLGKVGGQAVIEGVMMQSQDYKAVAVRKSNGEIEVKKEKIDYITDATVIDVNNEKIVTAATRDGLKQYKAKAVVLTMGCRERTRGAISTPGTRPAGIYNAGVAQRYINLTNTMVGKKVVILGSGDIGLSLIHI